MRKKWARWTRFWGNFSMWEWWPCYYLPYTALRTYMHDKLCLGCFSFCITAFKNWALRKLLIQHSLHRGGFAFSSVAQLRLGVGAFCSWHLRLGIGTSAVLWTHCVEETLHSAFLSTASSFEGILQFFFTYCVEGARHSAVLHNCV